MLLCLTVAKKISKQSTTPLALSDLYKAIQAQGLMWQRTEIAFHADGSHGRSIKSLKTVAKQNAFLQPSYRQKVPDRAAAGATPSAQHAWKIENFAEAMADKDQKRVILPFIEWTLPADEPDCQETLHAIDKILVDYPPKNYQYRFETRFLGLNFGDQTLEELPGDYANGRGPFTKDGMNDALRTIKWAFSQVRFTADKSGSSVLFHCLLGEGDHSPEVKPALPEAFANIARSVLEFKAKDVMRREIRSVQESGDHGGRLAATSIESPEIKINPAESAKRLEDRHRLEQLAGDVAREAQQHLDALMAEGKLPHQLERYYFPEGILRPVGKNESGRFIMESIPNPNPDQTSYAAYHQIWAPEGQEVPPSLVALGYDREPVRTHFEQQRNFFLAAYQNLAHAMGHFKKTLIDGVDCVIVTADREKFNRRKILAAVFKPLGYEFVKQPQGSTGAFDLRKSLSATEFLRCIFDFGTWRQTIDCSFAYENDGFSPRLNAFRMRLTGWSRPTSIDITSEELFNKTIENIGASASIIENEHIPGLRAALKAWRENSKF
jgi:hypothetical protein